VFDLLLIVILLIALDMLEIVFTLLLSLCYARDSHALYKPAVNATKERRATRYAKTGPPPSHPSIYANQPSINANLISSHRPHPVQPASSIITKTKPSPSSHPQYNALEQGTPSRPSTPGSGATRRQTAKCQKRRAGQK
jgi:hypothetical protein